MTEAKVNDISGGYRMKLAQAYIRIQMYGETFDPYRALRHGTLFPELYRPYRPRLDT